MASTSNNARPGQSNSRIVTSLLAIIPLLASLAVLVWGFFFLRDIQLAKDSNIPQAVTVLLAIIWGVGGVVLLFTTANFFIEQLSDNWIRRLQPVLFVGPAILMLVWALVLPTIRTLFLSFYDEASVNFVWFENFKFVFTNDAMLVVFRNNLMWMFFGTLFTASAGLLIAVLADKSKFESFAKALIFMPMAISFVGAGVIWNFVYSVKPVDAPQIGLLNSLVVFFGGQPQAWTAFFQPWNNFFLILIVIWLQTGYAMVLFSAAIKGVSTEILEAARVDGATELQVFFRIMIPQIMGTIITVSTTIIIFTLKIFDVVIVMTGGQYGTSVIATEFYRQYFTYNNNGVGSAIAIVLLIAVTPVMAYNLRQFAQREVF
ncbi:MAG TPA: sugar ABC transporter permease [Anaerolineales bacterium]|nr:sugar ABC transporter permease [Anaerolineales bacterium]